MRNLKSIFLLICIFILSIHQKNHAQALSVGLRNTIEKEVSAVFDQSINAGEKLDINSITNTTDDHLSAGFIDNGNYYDTFDQIMKDFKKGAAGLEYQKINVETQKITVLSSKSALLTAKGSFSAKIVDGRIINGRFACTFVYHKINDEWKVIHSHMSNPN